MEQIKHDDANDNGGSNADSNENVAAAAAAAMATMVSRNVNALRTLHRHFGAGIYGACNWIYMALTEQCTPHHIITHKNRLYNLWKRISLYVFLCLCLCV